MQYNSKYVCQLTWTFWFWTSIPIYIMKERELTILLDWLKLTLGDEDAFVDVRQTTGKERAELDEVVNANTVLLWLSTASVALLGVFRWIIWSRGLHGLALVLLWVPFWFFLLRDLSHELLRHRAHGCELGADRVHLVALKFMLFTDLFDLLVTQHATRLSNFFLILLTTSCLCAWILTIVLLDLESRSSSPILSKRVWTAVAVCQTLSRPLVWLCLFVLVSVSKCLLPFFSVLTTSETANACNLADLIINLINVDISLELLHGPDEGDFTHHYDLLQQEVD